MTGSVLAQDYDAGIAALKSGQFAIADREFRPLAEAGHGNAQYQLGVMYEYGRGLVRSDANAVIWYRKAAAQDIVAAQYRLGVLHDNGWGVDRNYPQAAYWYRKAAMVGHGFAQHDLAFMYLDGKGVTQDLVQAYKWLKIAQMQGNKLMAKHLRLVALGMTASQIDRGRRLAFEWHAARKVVATLYTCAPSRQIR